MIKLKSLLLRIARIPARDQRWILNQLNLAQHARLTQCNGLDLLQEALRFKNINPSSITLTTKSTCKPLLPNYCNNLALQAPLYIAIILEQGSYSWTNLFLKTFDLNGLILASFENTLSEIKPAIKIALFKMWDASISFENYLDIEHG